jgi:hypothetical protein
MPDKIKDKAPIDFTHPSIGGRKVGEWMPAKQGKEIDFSSIPGVRCVMPPPLWAKSEPPTDAAPDAPAESGEKEDEGRAGNGA